MPITKSAQKALRQSKKNQRENLVFKKNFKDALKECRDLITAKSFEKARAFLPTVYQTIDKAAGKRVIKKNTASRYKSRLMLLFNKASVQK